MHQFQRLRCVQYLTNTWSHGQGKAIWGTWSSDADVKELQVYPMLQDLKPSKSIAHQPFTRAVRQYPPTFIVYNHSGMIILIKVGSCYSFLLALWLCGRTWCKIYILTFIPPALLERYRNASRKTMGNCFHRPWCNSCSWLVLCWLSRPKLW